MNRYWTAALLLVFLLVLEGCFSASIANELEDVEAMPQADIRDLIEKFFESRKELLRKFLGMISGETSFEEIKAAIYEVFGSFSAVAVGLVQVLKYLGIAGFKAFLAKLLGNDRDFLPPTMAP